MSPFGHSISFTLRPGSVLQHVDVQLMHQFQPTSYFFSAISSDPKSRVLVSLLLEKLASIFTEVILTIFKTTVFSVSPISLFPWTGN